MAPVGGAGSSRLRPIAGATPVGTGVVDGPGQPAAKNDVYTADGTSTRPARNDWTRVRELRGRDKKGSFALALEALRNTELDAAERASAGMAASLLAGDADRAEVFYLVARDIHPENRLGDLALLNILRKRG